ncbi:Six-hairpin glycosidase-like protein [Nemania sp. FL0031]|nr:Six-hairpin glycosidase-like protein [Nemania sp. FL0031]
MALRNISHLIFGLMTLNQGAITYSHRLSSPLHKDTNGLITGTTETITLNSASDSGVVILDYGHVVEGIPIFDVISVEGDTSVFEITYAESLTALDSYMSDGPLVLAAAMDTYRVNRYSIAKLGTISNRLIQGSFRYQKLNLSSSGTLVLQNVGARSTVDTTPIAELPGSFQSSDNRLNAIWNAGARTIQMTEIPKGSVPNFVEVTSEGTWFESLAPQAQGSAAAAQLLRYDLMFSVKVAAGGFGFLVLSDTLNSGIYIACDIDRGTITAHAGTTSINDVIQTTNLPLNLTMGLGKWHSVQASVAITDIIVTIDGVEVMSISQQIRLFGSYGFGASFGHRAIFRNLSVVTPAGEELYSHPLTDPSFLPDFFMGLNPLDTIVDGSRRDRVAYAGDLDISGGAALASTHGLKYFLGSLELLGSYQVTTGFFIPTAKIQQEPLPNPLNVNITGLIGYSFNILTAAATLYMHTGDAAFAREWGPKAQKMLDWADSQTLENGLFNLSDVSFGGDWNYYDPPQAGVVTKFNVVYAYALQECLTLLEDGGIDIAVYKERLSELRHAIDSQLWSDGLQAYYLSESISDGFGQDSNALAILAGVNLDPAHSTQTILSTLSKDLMTAAGPLAFSSGVVESGFQRGISPFASAYHLRAALDSKNGTSALELLNTLWLPMVDESNANYTGTMWEYVDAEGRPGLGITTSLCHGWSAGPTAELSKYVLGVMPTRPGWVEFRIAPLTLGLKAAEGKVPTIKGSIYVKWDFDERGLLSVVVDAPGGTRGTIYLPEPLLVPAASSTFEINLVAQNETSFEITGGVRLELKQKQSTSSMRLPETKTLLA